MGKRPIVRARGKGGPAYHVPSHRWLADVAYKVLGPDETLVGVVEKIAHDPARNTPVALVNFNGERTWLLAHEGLSVGDIVQFGAAAETRPGNVLQLLKIPEGSSIFNIEATPDDGGKFARSSGAFGVVIAHMPGRVKVMLPSKRIIDLDARCRATIGVAAGGDRKVKPMIKAGAAHYLAKARGKRYPRMSARSMNVVDHKFGGSHLGIPKSAGRAAPPGRKVGSIASRRTGKKKK